MPQPKSISVFLRGGLGNQLFQYASGLWLSELQERALVIRDDLLPAHEDKINGVSRWPNQISEFNHSGEVRSRANQPPNGTNSFGKGMQLMRQIGDVSPAFVLGLGCLSYENKPISKDRWSRRVRILNGYSSEKSIVWAVRRRLREQLNQVRNPSPEFVELLEEISREPTVVIHVRQGDYLSLETLYGKLPVVYYSRALEQLDSANMRLWIFTDSPESLSPDVLRFMKPDRIIGPLQISRAVENMVLMSHANGLVASNSTFSWWAGCISGDETKLVAPLLRSAKVNIFDFEFDVKHNWNLIEI